MLLAYNEFLFVRVLAVTEWTLPVAMSALTGGESTTIAKGLNRLDLYSPGQQNGTGKEQQDDDLRERAQ